MRSLRPDSEYFAFLDGLRDGGAVNTVLSAAYLVREYPELRAEEAGDLRGLARHLPRAQDPRRPASVTYCAGPGPPPPRDSWR